MIRLREFTKEQLDVDEAYFKNFSEANPKPIQVIGLKHINLKKESEKIRKRFEAQKGAADTILSQSKYRKLKRCAICTPYTTTHNILFYNLPCKLVILLKNAAKDKQSAIALTDTGNMMAAFHFVSAVLNHNKGAKATNEI